jgi:hypothetical protein
MFVQ